MENEGEIYEIAPQEYLLARNDSINEYSEAIY